MDLIRIHLIFLLFIVAIFLIVQTQNVFAQEYFNFENIPEVNSTFGNLIISFESDLNIISSLA